MPRAKRGVRAAVGRDLLIPLLAVAVIGLTVFIAVYLTDERELSETEKATLREQCVGAYRDPLYSLNSAASCDNMGFGTRQTCIAWTTGNSSACDELSGSYRSACIAKATKNPLDCDAIGDPTQVIYCKAFVTRNGALCSSIDPSVATWQLRCEATVNDNLEPARSRVGDLCGEYLLPSE